MVMFFPSAGVFAQKKNEPVKKDIAAGVPEGEHINAFRVDTIIDSGVINLEGKPIGTIDDLVIDIDTGRIAYAVLEFGGFVGFGDKLFAVPWQSLSSVPAEGIFILDQSKANWKKPRALTGTIGRMSAIRVGGPEFTNSIAITFQSPGFPRQPFGNIIGSMTTDPIQVTRPTLTPIRVFGTTSTENCLTPEKLRPLAEK